MRESLKKLAPLIVVLLALPILLVAIPEAVRYLGRASGTPANLVIDMEGIIGPLPHPWRNLAQGGEELDKPMIASVINETKALQPEYIRLDHLYDGYNIVSRGGDGTLTYDWSRLDATIKDILATGAKPFLALSYMPPAISRGDIVDLPRDWGEWEAVVQATIEHYSGVNQMNIPNVYYEVWNEPDLFGGYKISATEKNYLTLYSHSAAGARRAKNVNAYKLGGPATTALYKNWVNTFLDFCQKNNIRLDFYSWHRYNTDLEQFEDDWNQIYSWLDDHPERSDMELTITEWGHDSEVDPGYDTKFGAIHTLAVSRVMMGKISKGFIFEIKDGPGASKLWGRWGLMTNDKYGAPEKKPRYNAIQLLNSLGENRVSVGGEGSWVKAIGSETEGVYKILVINYDASGKHAESVPVTLDNLPKRNFSYKRTDFLGGSKSQNVATTEAKWRTLEYMAPNSAAMIEVRF